MFLVNTYIIQAKNADNVDEYKVFLTEGEVISMQEMWTSQWQRPPTKTELQGMINQRVEEAILFREAVKIGLNKNDNIIRQRMAQKLEFLSNDLVKPDSATAEEVHAYFEQNISKYTTPENITFTQLYVNPKVHGDLLEKEVTLRLRKLNSMDVSSTEINKYNDQFSLQSYFPYKSQLKLAKLFGSEFAAGVFTLDTDKWLGLVYSQYGVHLVYVMHKNPAVVPEFETVKGEVTDYLQREKKIALNNLYIDGILSRYEVIIEGGEGDNIN
jgi:hypothetical protein